jgi:hypothetical protein
VYGCGKKFYPISGDITLTMLPHNLMVKKRTLRRCTLGQILINSHPREIDRRKKFSGTTATRVSVETMEIVEAMKEAKQGRNG